jgi:hypothetical protein
VASFSAIGGPAAIAKGDAVVHDPRIAPKLDSGHLATWLAQHLDDLHGEVLL